MRKTIPTALLIGTALLPSVAAAGTPASCPTVSERGGYIYDPCQGTLTYPPASVPRWAVNFGPELSGPDHLVAGPLYLSPKGGTIALAPGTACNGQADVRTTKRPIGVSDGKHLWGKRWSIPGCGPTSTPTPTPTPTGSPTWTPSPTPSASSASPTPSGGSGEPSPTSPAPTPTTAQPTPTTSQSSIATPLPSGCTTGRDCDAPSTGAELAHTGALGALYALAAGVVLAAIGLAVWPRGRRH